MFFSCFFFFFLGGEKTVPSKLRAFETFWMAANGHQNLLATHKKQQKLESKQESIGPRGAEYHLVEAAYNNGANVFSTIAGQKKKKQTQTENTETKTRKQVKQKHKNKQKKNKKKQDSILLGKCCTKSSHGKLSKSCGTSSQATLNKKKKKKSKKQKRNKFGKKTRTETQPPSTWSPSPRSPRSITPHLPLSHLHPTQCFATDIQTTIWFQIQDPKNWQFFPTRKKIFRAKFRPKFLQIFRRVNFCPPNRQSWIFLVLSQQTE